MSITLNIPLFLLLWLTIPVLWVMIHRSFMKAGSRRYKIITGGLRTLLLLLLGIILADPVMKTHTDRVNLFFCLDASSSMDQEDRTRAEEFIRDSAGHMEKGDSAGLILFGKRALLDTPLREDFQLKSIRSDPDPDLTNISDALQMAIGRFPQKGENRIVLFTDGNENMNHSLDTAQLAGSLGMKILPVPLGSRSRRKEIFIREVRTPPLVPLETAFQVRIEITASGSGRGDLILFRDGTLLTAQGIGVQPGNNVFTFSDMLEEARLHSYRAVIHFPEDGFFQNNEGLSYTRSIQRSRVLYLTEDKNMSTPATKTLTLQGLHPVIRGMDEFSGSLEEILEYEAVVLDNVSGRTLSFGTMENLKRYVRDLGGGLIMIGGDKSFGAGYYGKTPLEEALPVYMDVPTDVKFSGLCIIYIIDKSASMVTDYSGKSKLEMAKIAAFSSIEMLNPNDHVGIMVFDSQFEWLVPVTRARERQAIADRLSRVKEGGGTILYPALERAFQVLQRFESQRKHIIILSDGETDKADFESLVRNMGKEGISVSTVCIGSHSDVELMRSISRWGGGRYYYTDRPEQIPNIFTGETEIVKRKIITEKVLQPRVQNPNEIVQGMKDPFPVLHGLVVTYPKPGADVVVRTMEGPLLTAWRYGLGRSAAFASDLSGRWGKEWLRWEHYGRFISQMVKWTQRKEAEERYVPHIHRKGERGTFTVDVLTKKNEYVNNRDLWVKATFPSGGSRNMELDQVSPGRYQCDFPAEEIGGYYFTLFEQSPYDTQSTRVFGFGIPYTDEFRVMGINHHLLERLAAVTGGEVLEPDRIPANLFRAASEAREYDRALWPFLVVISLLLLLADVAARKLIRYS